MKITGRLVLLTCLAIGFSSAIAEPTIDSRSASIRASSSMPADDLYRLIRLRASQVCRTHAIAPYVKVRLERECRQEFVTDAVRTFNRPELNVLHEHELGKTEGIGQPGSYTAFPQTK